MNQTLKCLRAHAGFSAQYLADAVGVPLDTVLQCEEGSLPVPEEYSTAVANLLQTTKQALQGNVKLLNNAGLAALHGSNTHYGYAAFHFLSGGSPLVVSVSHAEHKNILAALGTRQSFLKVISLHNQSIYIRCSALADVYVSHSTCDTLGPEQDIYRSPMAPMPSPIFWKVVGDLHGALIEQEYGEGHLRRLLEPKESDIANDIERGDIDEGDRADAFKRAMEDAAEIFENATCLKWQMGTQRRCEEIDSSTRMYPSLRQLENTEFDDLNILQLIYFTVDEGHRSIFINASALDYISVPLHRINLEIIDQLDALEATKTLSK